MRHINIIGLIIISLIIGSCQNNEFGKDSDAVYKSINKTYTLNTDGSVNFQYQHQLKYITHNSFNRMFGESFIIYNPQEQELKINKAETKMVDGKIIPSPENAFNEVLPHFAAGAPAYNHFREMVVTHTALEPGCVVDFDYEISSQEGYLPYLNDNIIIQQDVPVEKMNIIVKVPQGTDFNYKLINSEIKPEIKEKDGFVIYNWEFNKLNALSHEVNQPHDQAFLPRLIFSTVNLTDALKNLYTESDLMLTDDIKTLARKRIFGIRTGINIIKEIQKIVGSELNDFDIPIEYSAYSIKPLNEVWNSNGGTNMEKTILLNELLKHIGFESKIIMAVSPVMYDKNIGCLKDFGHLYIQVKADGEEFIIGTNPDQTNNLMFELKETGIIDLEGNSVNLPEFIYETESSFSAKGDFNINESGDLVGKVNMKLQGLKNPYLNYLADAEYAKEIAYSMYSTKAITDFEVILFENLKSEIEARIEQKETWEKQGNYYFVNLPSSNFGIKNEHLGTLLNERQTPFKLSNQINESYNFSLTIPKEFSLVAPIKKELSNELGSVLIEINAAGNNIHIVKSLKINKDLISSEEYINVKNLLDIWNKKTYNEIILKSISE